MCVTLGLLKILKKGDELDIRMAGSSSMAEDTHYVSVVL